MAKKKEPAAQFGWILNLTALCTGAFMAKTLLLVIPALSEYKLWIMIGLMLLIWLVFYLWLRHEQDEPLPARFAGFTVGAAFGVVAFFSIELLELIVEQLVDLTAYETIIGTMRLACPGFFGIIGALTYKKKENEEDYNNG